MRTTKWFAFSMLAAVLFAASGCNTTEGLGEDIEKGGRKLKQEAREHQ